jgi:hypothetical protein
MNDWLKHYTYSTTGIDWPQDVLDLRNIVEVRDELVSRDAHGAECAHCEQTIELIPGFAPDERNAYRHVGGARACNPRREQEARETGDPLDEEETAEPAEEPLDEDEQRTLREIRELEAALPGTLDDYARNEPTLIAERYWEDYAQEYLEETSEIPDFLEGFIDWARWAEHLQQDWSEVLVAGYTFYVRSY